MSGISTKIQYFESIPTMPKRDMVLSRLGYRKGITTLNRSDLLKIEEGIQQGSNLCKPMGAYLLIPISSRDDSSVTLGNGLCLHSQSLSKLLQNSTDVILMASSVGKEVTEFIFEEVNNKDAAKGLIIDSVASQTADATLDWIVQLLARLLAREGKKLTKHRYSPGFGDLSLSYQKDIFEILKLGRLDMMITEKMMLVPEKSVIAVIGVEEEKGV